MELAHITGLQENSDWRLQRLQIPSPTSRSKRVSCETRAGYDLNDEVIYDAQIVL